ncbi:unnamed protein product [Cyprideis torosa]|uniref:Uncharacterized protein n=1 Tax=Cyprideis torosa TaxID=163714 RepID=A0A7R8ZK92_9CRUS|nr:unnamed protein product [Cyprideis torosa]CAG0883998.1 unnamed protein product [Cyprideis torosa]
MAAAVTSFKQPDLKEKLPLRPRFAEFLATINIPESVDQADSAATFMVNPLRSVGICLMAHEMPLSPSAMIACMTSEASRLRPCECRIKEEKDDEDVDVLKAAPKAALSAGAKAVTGAIAGGTAAIAIAELLPKLEPQLVDASAGPATLTPTKVHVCSCDCEPKCRERPAFLIGEGLNASLCYLDECTAEESILEEVFSTVCPEGEEQTYTSDSRTLCYDSEAVDKSTREIESFSLSIGKAIVPTQKTTEVSPMLWGISKDDVRRKRAPLIKTSPVPPKRNQKSIQGSGQIRPSPRIQIAGVDDNREVGADSLNSDTSTTTRYELQEELKRIQRRVSGFALLLLGVWLTLDQERILLFGLLGPIGSEVDALWTLALALLGLGVVVVFTGAFGCCGSIRRSKCILCLYIFVVLMVLASEVALAILSILFHGRVNRFVDESSEDNIVFRRLEVDYGRESRFTTIMDLAQYKFMCCGINGYEDYERTAWRLEYLGGSSLRVPLTCCVMRKSSKTSFLNPTPVNQTSCQSELQHRFLYDRYTERAAKIFQENSFFFFHRPIETQNHASFPRFAVNEGVWVWRERPLVQLGLSLGRSKGGNISGGEGSSLLAGDQGMRAAYILSTVALITALNAVNTGE